MLPTHSPRCRRGTSAWRRATSSCTPSSSRSSRRTRCEACSRNPNPTPAPTLPNPRVEQPSPIPNANPSPSHTRHQALDLELAKERQRNSITAEHYRAQEQDAAKLTAENRLLLERVRSHSTPELRPNPNGGPHPNPNPNPNQVHGLSTALEEHKKEVETLRNDNVHQVRGCARQ